jgi:hypothetical protein
MLIIPVRSSKPLILILALPCLLALLARKRSYPAGELAGATPFDRAVRAAQTNDTKVMRAEAKRLRAEGHAPYAQALETAADIAEKMKVASSQPPLLWPAGADPVSDMSLRNPPSHLTQDDLMVAAWLRDEDNGGPAFVTADLYPDRELKRRLTPRERWVLAPYFHVASDMDPELNFGVPKGMPAGAFPANVYAVTFGTPDRGCTVVFPRGPQSLLSRWWMAVLVHELVHVAQLRLAGGDTGATAAQIKWGYERSPTEVQARYYQRLVYNDLVRRARESFLSRGPMPMFP